MGVVRSEVIEQLPGWFRGQRRQSTTGNYCCLAINLRMGSLSA
jgi:hypothetical protein